MSVIIIFYSFPLTARRGSLVAKTRVPACGALCRTAQCAVVAGTRDHGFLAVRSAAARAVACHTI